MLTNKTLFILAVLSSVLPILAPNEVIDTVMIETQGADRVAVNVSWQAGAIFSLNLLEGDNSAPAIIYRIFSEMQDFLADSEMAWGQARPQCPGHNHPRNLAYENGTMWWECPESKARTPEFTDLLSSARLPS